MIYIGHVSWVGSVLYRSCTSSQNGLSVYDLSVDDIYVDDLSVGDLSDMSDV